MWTNWSPARGGPVPPSRCNRCRIARDPPAVELTAYRLVQEALSNAGRHAPGAMVTVAFARDPDVVVSVRNGPTDRPSGGGRGTDCSGCASGWQCSTASCPRGRSGRGFRSAHCWFRSRWWCGVIRVLVVDDQAMVREGFAALLSAQPDITVVGDAANGAEAVAACRRLDPDVVLMDVRMPVMDGLVATGRILDVPAGATPPKVLILTTFDLDDYVFGALRAGASGFVLKDAPAAELSHAVRVVAAGDALLAPSVTRRLIADYTRGAGRTASGPPRSAN